ncbi:MAG: 4Fe-4S binding protein [Treponema sp.]|nr:4Fe-4S binding protein [Treponema sp.]
MSIKIDENRCVGCSRCVEVCPGNLLKLRTTEPKTAGSRVAYIRHERDCWGCTSCVKVCPRGAVSLYLGADIGGRGASLTVKTDGSVRTWRITKSDGTVQEITVNSSDANTY